MSTTAAKIAAMEEALGQGILTVTYNGRTTTYKSTDDLIKAITYFRQRTRSTPGYKIDKLVSSKRD